MIYCVLLLLCSMRVDDMKPIKLKYGLAQKADLLNNDFLPVLVTTKVYVPSNDKRKRFQRFVCYQCKKEFLLENRDKRKLSQRKKRYTSVIR